MIIIGAQIIKQQTVGDRGLRLHIDTLEPDEEQTKEIVKCALIKEFGWFIFKPSTTDKCDITDKDLDLPDFVPDFPEEKSPAKKLRDVLYRLYEQEQMKLGKTEEQIRMSGGFEVYYRQTMEMIRQKFIQKLKPRNE